MQKPITQISEIPPNALLRLKQFLPHIVPVSRTVWYKGVASGRYPQPVRFGPRLVAWRSEDIKKLVEGGLQ